MSNDLKPMKPTRQCQGRIGTKSCGKPAVAMRDEQPRFVCAACQEKLKTDV